MFRLNHLKKFNIFLRYGMSKSKPLTHDEAKLRFDQFTRDPIQYTFHVKLLKGKNYQGLAESNFHLQHANSDLRVDFTGQNVTKLFVNEQPAEKIEFDGNSITVPSALLKQGANTIAVSYENIYNIDGNGCVSFVDVDEKQYLYTQFEPYHANKVFPLFDQPDLKAQMKLNILSPKEWKVLSNELPSEPESAFNYENYNKNVSPREYLQNDLKTFTEGYEGNMWIYPSTKILPTYLFCFIAGEYFELKCPNPYKNLPMSLYCIESLSENLKDLAPFMWEVTIESMKFFEEYFGFPFSFNKYEQVFAHEYKWGAMENAGIVTFNDLYVFKEKVSTERMLSLANTVSHELAHHWFGNLVTMKWWDNLWLNESFADYISHYCLEKIKDRLTTIKYESSMAPFNARKAWGYHDDQLVTTHPINGAVANAQIAQTIFDGITYSKGAATMKQLQHLMTEEKFGKALSEYFHKFQWANTILADFIGCMQNHFHNQNFTLEEWQKVWLEKACHNRIEPIWNCQCKEKQAKLEIIQTPVQEANPTLRMHALKIGFYKSDFTADVKDVLLLPVESSTIEYDGSNNYEALLLNYEDYSFVKGLLDAKSSQFFSKNLSGIKDLLSRALIWRAFYDMVKDAKITVNKYIDFFINNIEKEPNDGLFEKQFDLVSSAINSLTPRIGRDELNERVFELIRKLISSTDKESANRIIVLKSKLASFAHNPKLIKILIDWRANKIEDLKDHPQTLGQQWSTVIKAYTLADLTPEEKEAIFADQEKIDPSDTAKNNRKTVEALRSTPEEYEQIYESYKKDSELSMKQKTHSIRGWNHPHHHQRLAAYRERFFNDLPIIAKSLNYDNAVAFLEEVEPNLEDIGVTLELYDKVLPLLEEVDYVHLEARKAIDNLKIRHRTYNLWHSEVGSKL